MKRLHLVLGLALLSAGTIASAQTTPPAGQPGFGGEHPGHGLVRAACEGKPVGTQVQVTFPNGQTRTIACGEHHHHEGAGAGQARQ